MKNLSTLTAVTKTSSTAKRRSKLATLVEPQVVPVMTNTHALGQLAAGSDNTDSIVDSLVSLREQGTAFYETHFVPGRKAMLGIMSQVYAQFHAAKSAPKYQDDLKAIREKLKQYDVKVRSTSSDASLFIRLVFKDFDDKQVSIYSRSLLAAYAAKIGADDFTAYIENTVGGFYGVVIGGDENATPPPLASGNAGKVALYDVIKEPTIETIADFSWEGDEEQCVLVAVRGMQDDSAQLKKIRMSQDLFNLLLAKYSAEKKALLKKTVTTDEGATKGALQTFEHERGNLETQVGNLEAELRTAVADGNSSQATKLRMELKVAMVRQEQAARAIKQLKGEMSTDAKEPLAA
jgi:hypothetical protein